MGKGQRKDEPHLPTFTNPTYQPSETDNESIQRKRIKSEDNASLELKKIDYKDSDESSSGSANSFPAGVDPLETLRNLAREISPGITLAPIRKESMSDPDSPFNTAFPVIIPKNTKPSPGLRNSEKGHNKSDESYWDLSLPTHHKRSSLLFTKRSSYNDEVFDIDEILNLKPKYFGFTRKQWMTLFVFSFVNIFSAILINLQAPFYPRIAEEKGATEVEIGLVFGSFELIVFALSPLFGKYMDDLGPMRVFNVGILVTGSCSMLFGFLTFVESRILFVALSFILRVTEAIGTAGHVTATFTLIAIEFPDSIFTVFASMETCSGLGLIIGPLLGSLLFEAGSSFGSHFQFLLPFVTLGGVLFVGKLMTYSITASPQDKPKSPKNSPDEKHGIIDLLKLRSVSLAAFSIFATAVSLGFHSSSLEPHIRQFDLDTISSGAMFVINGGTYAITAPLIGRICDRISNPKVLIFIGALFIFLGYTVIGPAPFFPFKTILWLTCLGLLVQGLGLSCSFVSAFTQGMRDALEGGFPDSVNTYGLVSGMWLSFFALGNCVGPIAAGFLTQNFNYGVASVFVMGLQLLVMGISMVFILRSNRDSPSEGSKDPDLEIHDSNGIAVRKAKFYSEFNPAPPLQNQTEKIKENVTVKGFDSDDVIHRL